MLILYPFFVFVFIFFLYQYLESSMEPAYGLYTCVFQKENEIGNQNAKEKTKCIEGVKRLFLL